MDNRLDVDSYIYSKDQDKNLPISEGPKMLLFVQLLLINLTCSKKRSLVFRI